MLFVPVRLVVPGWRYRLFCLMARLLPHALLLKLMARNSGKIRRAE